MKNTLAFLLALCMGLSAIAQQYFYKRYSLGGDMNTITGVVPIGNKYYGVAASSDSMHPTISLGVRFFVLNSLGVPLKDTFCYATRGTASIWHRSICTVGDSMIYVGINEDTNLVILGFDTLAHLRFKKTFAKTICPTDSFQDFVDLQPTGTGEWLILATIRCPYLGQFQNASKLTKLDSNFDVIWTQRFGDFVCDDVPSRLLVADGEYVILASYNNSNSLDIGNVYQTHILRIDSSGRLLWQWYSNNRKLEGSAEDIIKTKDGGFIYCGMGNGYIGTPGRDLNKLFMKGYIAKIDSSGSKLWSDTFSYAYSNPRWGWAPLTGLKEMSDSSIMVAGNIFAAVLDSPRSQYSTLMKFTPRGSLVWKRKYIYADYLLHRSYDFRETQDGGFVMCGSSLDYLMIYSTAAWQQGWVLKVDGDGCLSLTDPQCHPTLVPDVGWQQDIGVYPNPVSTILTIDVPVSLREWQLEVFDMLGRKMLTHQSAYMREKIDVSSLTPGGYTYHLTTEGMEIKSGKIAKY